MIRACLLFMGFATFTVQANDLITDSDPFLELNGRLIVEVEQGPATGSWSLENSIYGHTGNGYLVWSGPNNYAKSEAPRGNPVEYRFRINTPGNYQLRWRSRNTVGVEATEHNDSWVRFPTGRNIEGEHFLSGWTKAYMGQVEQWTWDAYTVDNDNKPIRQYFDTGDHTIEIAGRSNGHGLDRFALYRYELEDFSVSTFDTLAQSPRLSEAGRPGHRYTGNSCVGNTLSLAADASSSSALEGSITINKDQAALLRFDVPAVRTDQVSLKLASTRSSLALSAYLGSHGNWAGGTALQNLPYPSVLLGTYQNDAVQDQILQLDASDMVLPAEPLTIILQSDDVAPQNLHGIATALEPRLDIQVTPEFCRVYQAGRSGTGVREQEQEQERLVDETHDPIVEFSAPEPAPESIAEPATEPQITPPSFDGEVAQNNEDTEAATDRTAATRSGALSLWALMCLAFVTILFRTRHVPV